MSFKKVLSGLFILMLVYSVSFCQVSNQALPTPQPIPPSPNAASLGKYGEIPVSMYTGIPDISVPLWQINEGDIKLPLSLSYHASGVKVEDNASWVGLGWSLNAGGVITRSVRGKPDENGYTNAQIPDLLLNPKPGTTGYCDQWSAALYVYLVGHSSFGYDSEPDAYYFNFNGVTGKFVFDQNGVPYTIPFQKLKIERPNLSSWIITTADGFVYKFGGAATETGDIYSVTYSTYGDVPSSKNETLINQAVPSSWYLYEIDSPTGRKVTLTYADEQYEVNSGISQQLYFNTATTPTTSFNPSNSSSLTKFNGKRLSAINFSNGNVSFLPGIQRSDVSSAAPVYALGKIVVNDGNNNPIKKFALNTDYFQSSDVTQDYRTERLRLNSVTELSGDESKSNQPYVFTYDSANRLPVKTSTSQDHWGFYNGKSNIDNQGRPVLIPTVATNYMASIGVQQSGGAPVGYSINGGPFRCADANASGCVITSPYVSTFQFQGANRAADFNYAKTGILTKIQFPTGGNTTFEYEPNDYDLKNYTYKTGSGGAIAFATCCDPLNNPVTRSGNQYFVTKTFTPNDVIPADLRSINKSVTFHFQFSANLDGYDNKCCKGCSTPYGYFKDVTTNTLLIELSGLSNLTTIGEPILAPIIKGQVNGVNAVVSQTGNTINISGIVLDPSHTYELFSRAATCPGTSCQEFPNCAARTNNMELYTVAGFDYSTNEVDQYNATMGGLRIHKISSYPATTDNLPVIKQYLYRVSSSPANQISSGKIIDLPVYMDIQQITTSVLGLKNAANFMSLPSVAVPVITVSNSSNLYVLTSGSKFELGQTNGSPVGYSEVQELYCPDGSCSTLPIGKKIYKYSTSDDYTDFNAGVFGDAFVNGSFDVNSPCPDPSLKYFSLESSIAPGINDANGTAIANIYPYPPKTSYDWKRGLLLSEATYTANGTLKRLVENGYNPVNDPNNMKVIPGVKIISDPFINQGGFSNHYFFGKYNIIAAWNYKNQEKVTETDDNNNTLVTTTNYFYDNPVHGLLTRTESAASNADLLQEKNKYVGDEGSIANLTASESDAIAKLKANFRYATLLEKDESRNNSLVKRTRTGYKDWGNSLLAPESTKIQIGANAMEARLNYQKYDITNGNLIQYNQVSAPPAAYQWGYKGLYPVAQVINAANNNIYFESFEEGTGNSAAGDAKTGHYSYAGVYSKTLSGLDNNIYTLSYWSKSGAVWDLILNNNISAAGNYTIALPAGQYDDIRFYPTSALMTTYTYDPLVGLTSLSDNKGNITYYEYDSLQRLMNIRDKDGNIIKHTDYHYQGQ